MNRTFAKIFPALLAGISLISAAPAQDVNNRLLLVFETSAAMKKCLPNAGKTVNRLFALDMSGQLQRGDTLGVWTFDRDVHTGQFPLQYWAPENAATIASNITTFLERQRYEKKTSFDRLPQVLNEVVRDSERLTALIFCDGQTEIHGTPFDAGINQVFKQKLAEQKEAQQPFVIVLRSQFGQYIGAAVGLPPAPLNFPEFPPLPAPPEPPPAPPPPAVVAPPPVTLPPLIIVGTNVGTNPASATVSAGPAATNPPPVAPTPEKIPAPETNVAKPTNVVVETNSVVRTNLVSSPSQNANGGGGALKIGATLLAAAVALLVLLWRRGRRSGDSLISRSMDKK